METSLLYQTLTVASKLSSRPNTGIELSMSTLAAAEHGSKSRLDSHKYSPVSDV